MSEIENLTDVEEAETEKLIPYPNNPKEHPEKQIENIASSIQEFGFTQPLVVDEENQVIIGHGRLQAAKKLGKETVPVIRRQDLSEAQAKALRIADNKVAESGWEEEKLEVELEQLDEFDYDITETGYSDEEISDILDEEAEVRDDGTDVAEEAESIEDPETVRGEIIKLGSHRLVCGDATSEEDREKMMDGRQADMVFTDPPYGIEFESGHRERGDFEQLENDDVILNVKKIIFETAEDDAHRYVCSGEQVFHQWRKQFDENYKNTIVWKKNGGGMGDLENDYAPEYELIIFCNPEDTPLRGKRESNVWEVDRDDVNSYEHPTQKPVELPAIAIRNSSGRNDIVADYFAGSGSTLLACEQLDRKCFTMEIDPVYCDVIVKRWEELTGGKPERIKPSDQN